MAFDATSGGASANSFVSVAEADTYFSYHRFASLWTEAETPDKEKALVMATRRLDTENYFGQKVTTTQALKWPRYDVFDEDGIAVPTTAIPQRIKDATCDLALEYLRSDPTSQVAEGLLQFSKIALPGITLEMREPRPAEGPLPSDVKRKLSLWLYGSSGVKLVRG